MDYNNFTSSLFIRDIPIKRRTYGSISQRFGVQILKDIHLTLMSDIDLGLRKRAFYDNFPEIVENLKDIIWEAFIEKDMERRVYEEE